ncbi:MAG: SPOR domain-containing protein [Halioglobus sp.]
MTTKDLNLSLDPELLQTTTASGPAVADTPAPPPDTREPISAPPVTGYSAKPPWKSTALIALLSVATVLGAAYWFVELSGKMPTAQRADSEEANRAIRSDLAELNIQISALQNEIQRLELAQNRQGELLKASIKEIKLPKDKLQKSKNLAKEKPDEVAKLVEDKDWYVNLGSFTGAKEAEGLRKKMLAIGYQPQIKKQQDQYQMSYKVVLPGFKNRESAEVAAKLLMEKTNLDSLWVWQGSEEG